MGLDVVPVALTAWSEREGEYMDIVDLPCPCASSLASGGGPLSRVGRARYGGWPPVPVRLESWRS